MMGRDKEGVDAAMAGFMSMLEDDKDSVPALLGMSLAFTLEDSPNKVRTRNDASNCTPACWTSLNFAFFRCSSSNCGQRSGSQLSLTGFTQEDEGILSFGAWFKK